MSDSAQGSGSAEVHPAQQANEIIEGQSSDTSGAEASSTPTPAAAKVEEKKRLNRIKLKVDQKEYDEELPFDFDDRPEVVEYLTKNLQMSKAASKRMSEYSQLEKEVTQFIEELKKDPRKVLSNPNINVDVKKLAASIIEEEINNSQKSPEQLKTEKLEAELQRLKDEREEENKTNSQKELERLQQQAYESYDIQMTQALEKSDLPKSPYVIKKMADYMLLGLQNKIDVTPADVIPLVRDEMTGDLKEMFAVMPDEVIESIIGKDVLNRIRKKKVAAVKSGAPIVNKSIPDTAKKSGDAKKDETKKLTFKQFLGI